MKNNPNKYLIIGNTDPSSLPGTHWVLFFLAEVVPTRPFSSTPMVKNLATIQAESSSNQTEGAKKTFNSRTPLSSETSACTWLGASAGYSLQTVLESFQPQDEKQNDEMVFSLVHRRFKFLNKIGHGKLFKKKKNFLELASIFPRKKEQKIGETCLRIR